MNLAETATVLRYAAAVDNRRTDDAVCVAWQQILFDVDYATAMQAVTRHFHDSTEYLVPGHIVDIAKDIRDERRRKTPHEIRALPSRFEPDDTRRHRLREGAAFCRLELGITPGEMQPLDPKNPVRDRALRRAKSENPNYGLPQLRNPSRVKLDKIPEDDSRINWAEFALDLAQRAGAAERKAAT